MATALQFGDEITVEQPRELASAQTMARFFFASFWAIVFTGAIRKWMFPHISIFYLLQDVPIGLAYVYALWKGIFDRGYLFLGIALLSAVLIFQGLMQIIISGLSIFVAVVGIHNYIFYLPMLLVFPLCLGLKYRRDFVKWYLYLSIPMCILAIAQAEAPTTAWINKSSEGEAFSLPGTDVARVAGTFNFTSFYGIWVAIAVAYCMGEWLLPKERRVIQKQWLLIVCTVAVNLCYLVSGSRSGIALAGMAIFGALVAAVVLGSSRAVLAIVGISVLVPIAAAMTYVISPREFEIVLERFTGEKYIVDGKERLLDGFIGFLIEPKFSLVGAGIGLGVDASHVGSVDSYNVTYTLSENDTIRIVMEMGSPVGLAYMFLRIGFAFGIIILSVRIVRNGSSPHVLPLSFFLVAQIYQGDLTRSATMTASQVMMAYAFILSAYYRPDNAESLEPAGSNLLMRSV